MYGKQENAANILKTIWSTVPFNCHNESICKLCTMPWETFSQD